MEDFKDVMEELSLVDIKTNKGWFTWVNNRDGNNMVKERLDRFLISANAIDKFPFLATTVVRQTNSDHDAIVMDTNFKDPRLFFKYDACWAKVKDAKDIIKRTWNSNDTNIIEKLEKVRVELGPWQHGRYKRMKNQICELVMRIDEIIDGPHREKSAEMLKAARLKLGHLYAKEECYWA
ncbi:reverse transcriptase [Gossypium australe]|uniref:Reverse transcriptase n=1 Tax=Gossypium australe TaxID=47621 RepID=A0A5B6WQF9_9ROSI|nr:reverse transcriptase [Gossypium australe]